MAVETREEKIRHKGRENADSIPLGEKATAALVAPSLAEERPTKKRPAHNIGFWITATRTVSQLAYQTRDCSGV